MYILRLHHSFAFTLSSIIMFTLTFFSYLYLSDNLAENISALYADRDVDEKKSWVLLGDCLKDMTSLIAAALFERVLILTAQSVRALLTVCGEMEEEICSSCFEAQSNFSSLLVHSIRYLHVYRCSLSYHSTHFAFNSIRANENEYSVDFNSDCQSRMP
jgi:hypothetical protein